MLVMVSLVRNDVRYHLVVTLIPIRVNLAF